MKKASKFASLKLLKPFFGNVSLSQLWRMHRSLKHEHLHWFNNQLRINTFFPPYPSIAFDRFNNIVVNKKRAPYQVYLLPTVIA